MTSPYQPHAGLEEWSGQHEALKELQGYSDLLQYGKLGKGLPPGQAPPPETRRPAGAQETGRNSGASASRQVTAPRAQTQPQPPPAPQSQLGRPASTSRQSDYSDLMMQVRSGTRPGQAPLLGNDIFLKCQRRQGAAGFAPESKPAKFGCGASRSRLHRGRRASLARGWDGASGSYLLYGGKRGEGAALRDGVEELLEFVEWSCAGPRSPLAVQQGQGMS
jgi:hypothetical protein